MTHKKKKTLSDNISFLLSNANGKLVNPDEDINTESQARVIDEEDLDDDLNVEVAAPSKLRQKNVALLDSIDRKYRGGVTSRKALKDYESDGDDGSDEDNSEDDSGHDEANEEESDDDGSGEDNFDEERDSEDEAIANLRKKGSESFVSYTDFSDGEESKSDNDVGEEGSDDDVDEEESEKGNDGDESMEDDFQHFSAKDTNVEVRKGQAVRNQISIWDSLMETRIQMQKVVTLSNQLPQANVMPKFRFQGGGSFISCLTKTENKVTKLLELLLSLQARLLKQFPETQDLTKTTAKIKDSSDNGMDEEIPSSDDEKDDDDSANDDEIGRSGSEDDDELEEEDKNDAESDKPDRKRKAEKESVVEKTQKKIKLDDYSDVLAKNYRDFTPYLNDTIQKWNTKTQVAVGRASSKNFSAFEQSTLKQIEHILADKIRLIRRTQLRRSDFRTLGQVKDETDKSDAPEEDQIITNEPLQEDQKRTVESSKEYDSEIFDDSDFYHQLLRELIEKKTADVTDPVQLGRQWIELQKMRSKMKRKVDVKASKGRRLRYTVHPKLVNFMAPQCDSAWSEEAKSELYASLFGQRKN